MTIVQVDPRLCSMNPSVDHEKLFDEICDKLNELSHKEDPMNPEFRVEKTDRLEKMQSQLRRSQDELKNAQMELQEKIKNFDSFNFAQTDAGSDFKKVAEQLESERTNNSKLSSDLAKSLELNLKLQFELEEVRSKANQLLNEERKHNQYLTDKNKALSHDLELSQALCNETRLQLEKAKDKFLGDEKIWENETSILERQIQDLNELNLEQSRQIDELKMISDEKDSEIKKIAESLAEFETYSLQQNEVMKNLSNVAEKKLIELKVALDKKTIESQDYHSHLQQALTQVAVLKQENMALKDYITKLTALHNQHVGQKPQQEVRC